MSAANLDHLVTRLRLALEPGSADDRELLNRYVGRRDAIAFEILVRRHGPAVLATCRGVLRNGTDADDAFQATFLTLAENARRVRTSAVGGWLVVVAHRISARLLTSRRRRIQMEAAYEPPAGENSDITWRESCDLLHAELDALPSRYRLPLVLCYLQGLSRDEAARQLGWRIGALKGRLERGRSRLRTRLARRGITLSAGLLAVLAVTPLSAVPAHLVRSAMRVDSPSTRAAGLAGAIAGAGTMKRIAAFTVAAGLLASVTLGDVVVRADPNPKETRAATPAPSNPAKPEAPAPETLTCAGRVLDPDGKPVSGAKVWLVLESMAVRRTTPAPRAMTTTDANGRFHFTEEGTGRRPYWSEGARVVATADGFGMNWAAADQVKDIRLVKDQRVTGRVINLEGKPVAEARVAVVKISQPNGADLSGWLKALEARDRPSHELWRDHFSADRTLFPAGGPQPGQPEAVVTDSQGRFVITGLGANRVVSLRIEGPTIATSERNVITREIKTITVPEDPGNKLYGTSVYYGATADHVVDPTQPFEGTVTDRTSGRPVVGATVRAERRRFTLLTTTDRNGRYRLNGLPPGVQSIMVVPRADQPYHRMAAGGGADRSQKPVTLDFALTRGHWVTGKLINLRTKKPEAEAPVWYFPMADDPAYLAVPGSRAWSTSPTTYTGPDGTFRVVAFPGRGAIVANGWSGAYLGADQRPLQGDTESLEKGAVHPNMLATSPATQLVSYNAAAIVHVEPTKPKEYTLTLDPGVAVSIELIDRDGKPVSGAGGGGLGTWNLWEPNLKASISALQYNPDRPRSLLFLHPEKGIGKLVEPRKGDTGPWKVTLEPVGRATGRILTADGNPVANAVLQIHYRMPGHDAWTPSIHEGIRTDADGKFQLANLVGGLTYSVHYARESGGTREQYYETIQVKSGQTKDMGDLKPR